MLQFDEKPPFKKYIKKLKNKTLKGLFKEAVINILTDPYCGEQKLHNLKDYWGYDIYDNGINYEIAYSIVKDEKGMPEMVIFYMAGTRENFWEEFKKYKKKMKK